MISYLLNFFEVYIKPIKNAIKFSRQLSFSIGFMLHLLLFVYFLILNCRNKGNDMMVIVDSTNDVNQLRRNNMDEI